MQVPLLEGMPCWTPRKPLRFLFLYPSCRHQDERGTVDAWRLGFENMGRGWTPVLAAFGVWVLLHRRLPLSPTRGTLEVWVDGGEEQGVVCFGTARPMQKYLRAGLV